MATRGRPFEPGNQLRLGKPNPNGGRKPRRDEDEIKGILDRGWPTSKRVAATKVLAEKAAEGNIEAYRILMAYAYGKPIERQIVWQAFDPCALSDDELEQARQGKIDLEMVG